MEGWISIHRKIQNSWIWEDKPFSKGQAWIDIIMMVNHKDNKIVLGNELILVKRGSRITSEVKLAKKWGWSRTKVRDFLSLLEKDKMIYKTSDNKKTTLTVVNYNDYQDMQTTEKHQKNIKRTSEKHQKNTNNNDNNENNDNNKDIEQNFEQMWSLYPNKKGKGKISNAKKKEIYKLREEFTRCIQRYKKWVESERKDNFEDLQYQHGSTFFNSGYIDYLDENVKEEEKPKRGPLKIVMMENYLRS